VETKKFLYGARDTLTGKLVNDITNPGRKFWETKGNCMNAINAYNNRTSYGRRQHHGPLELVVFELVEVKEQEKQN
jgi:hypothetical protein